MIWPGSQPGRRGLNSCFVPAALVGRCSGKANIPRPGIYRLAAPSLRLPARGTGRGAALLLGERRGPGSPLLPISVLSPLSSGSLRGHRRGGRGRAGTRRGPRQEAAAMGGFPPPTPTAPGMLCIPPPLHLCLCPRGLRAGQTPKEWGDLPRPGQAGCPLLSPWPRRVLPGAELAAGAAGLACGGEGAARGAFLTYLTALPSQWDAAPVTPRLYDPAARPRPGCTY